MTQVDLLVKGPHFYTMQGDGVGYQGDTAMAVDRGRIVAIAPQEQVMAEYSAPRTLDAAGHAVLPGFIDAHMHTGLCILRGLAQDTNNWMMYGLGPFSAQLNPAAMEAGSQLAILEGLRAGTTTFGDYGSQMDGVCRFIERVGARGRITVTVREAVRRVYNPGELYEFDAGYGRQTLAENHGSTRLPTWTSVLAVHCAAGQGLPGCGRHGGSGLRPGAGQQLPQHHQ